MVEFVGRQKEREDDHLVFRVKRVISHMGAFCGSQFRGTAHHTQESLTRDSIKYTALHGPAMSMSMSMSMLW
eukprot:scaffold109074_cov66-Phaeocystis_antarctica.AAC.2